MGHACTPADFPHSPAPDGEHPVTAIAAIVAILAAVLAIGWARVEVHGTEDLAALVEEEAPPALSVPSSGAAAENEAATSRWATGFSH
jgi:hypothetical protein